MALETLHIAQGKAAKLLGIDPAVADAEQTVHHGKIIMPDGTELDAYRVLTGPGDKIGKGGIRFRKYDSAADAEAEARELSWEMFVKIAARGHHNTFRGGKGVVNIGDLQLSAADKEHIIREFEALMESFGLADHRKDVPAGDLGTNGLMDIYAAEYARKHPQDRYADAVVTGKSPKLGGLEARSGATGLGVLSAQLALMDDRNVQQATVALQGFGNVASWYAYYATFESEGRVHVQAISEFDGMIWTTDTRGLPITEEMVNEIGDNKDWTGSKLQALIEKIKAAHPDMDVQFSDQSGDIISFEADYFIPAAMSNVITAENVGKVGAKLGIIEAGNGTTTAEAHEALVAKGLDVVADVGANSGGVDVSIQEWQADIALADGEISQLPGRKEIEDNLRASSMALMRDTLALADELDTKDLRVALVALAMKRTAGHAPTPAAA